MVRLLLAVRQAPPDTTLSAAFGPLRVTGATDVRARVAHTVDQPAAYFLALGDLAAAQRNHETAAYYYAQARQSAQQSGEGLADELNGRTSFQQAEINFWNGQYEQAAAAYSQAVAYGYRPAEAMKGMGWSWLALRNLDQAESAFRQAVMADPGLADAYVGLGWVMQARSDCTRAIEYFDRALTFDASLRDATLGVAQCQQSIAPVPSSPH